MFKNLATLIFTAGKEKTKLYNDIKGDYHASTIVNLHHLEVGNLNTKQQRQLRSMKFTGIKEQRAVDSALSTKPTTKSGQTPASNPGGRERYR